MIVVDTNVVSAFMTAPPPAAVHKWLNEQDAAGLYLTSISIAEVGFGLSIMPLGKRRRLLEERFTEFVALAFENRILSFDEPAARRYGEIRAHRQEIGHPMSTFDGQIAAIARTKGFAVATRNTKDFEACDLELVNPYAHTS